jgi:hypothetical protein
MKQASKRHVVLAILTTCRSKSQYKQERVLSSRSTRGGTEAFYILLRRVIRCMNAAALTAISGNEREYHRIRGARSNIGIAVRTLRRSHENPSQSSREAHKWGNVKILVREHAGGGSQVREI